MIIRKQEIDHRTMKLIVGLIALGLASLTNYFSPTPLRSISEAYHIGGWPESFFVGSLFAIAALLVAYDGRSTTEMVASKFAAAAALGVALFPCKCEVYPELVPHVHAISAALMFLILAYFCWEFYRRAKAKRYVQAKLRAGIYAVCLLGIVGSIAVLTIDNFTGGSISAQIPRLTFYGERTGLWAFGVSWLAASRAVPLITHRDEWFVPMVKVPADPDVVADAPTAAKA